MENTHTNKIKFFGLYLEQPINSYRLSKYSKRQNEPVKGSMGYLELRDISSITDDELGTIARFYNPTAFNVYIHDDQLTFDYRCGEEIESVAVELNSGFCLDFLRSSGFVTEWMGLSPYKLQEYGWIKLKSE